MRCFVQLALVALLATSIGCNLPAGPTTPTGVPAGSTGGGASNSQGTMTAFIANFPWTANGRVTATFSPTQNGIGASVFTVTGQDFPLTEMLSFTVSTVTAGSVLLPGTFTIGTDGINANLMDANGTTYQATGTIGSGSVTISTFSTVTRTASGTFTFVMPQSTGTTIKAVTTGNFNVTF
jgi:uncharacterized protein DUF6252